MAQPDDHLSETTLTNPLTAYRFQPDGSYQQVAHRIGDEPYETAEPLPVMIIPSALVTS